MKSYQHHIRDFNNATRHLSRVERSIYRDLIELYYEEEAALPKDLNWIARKVLARSNEELTAVEQVLNEFFTESQQGYYHERCEAEIEKFKANSSSKAIAGKASAEARKRKKQEFINNSSTGVEQPLNSVETEDQQNSTNHKPITINHKPNIYITAGAVSSDESENSDAGTPEKQNSKKPEYPDWFENLWQHYPPRSGGNDKRKALHAAQARIKSGKDPDYLLQAVLRYAQFVRANGNWGTQYVMQAATFLGPGEHIDNLWSFNHATNQQSYRTGGSSAGLAHDDTRWAEGLFPGISNVGSSTCEQPAPAIEGNFSSVVGGNEG